MAGMMGGPFVNLASLPPNFWPTAPPMPSSNDDTATQQAAKNTLQSIPNHKPNNVDKNRNVDGTSSRLCLEKLAEKTQRNLMNNKTDFPSERVFSGSRNISAMEVDRERGQTYEKSGSMSPQSVSISMDYVDDRNDREHDHDEMEDVSRVGDDHQDGSEGPGQNSGSLRVRSLISGSNYRVLKTFYDANPWPKKSDLAALANRCGLKRRVVQVS